MLLDSESVGDAARYRTEKDLSAALAALVPAPLDRGRVVHLVARREAGRREASARIALTLEDGVVGDAWARRPDRKIDAQVTVMQAGVAALLANGQPLELFGDNLFVDLDLSSGNLPAGSQVQAGGALLEVTPLPHNGCRKFKARFGEDALRFVQHPDTRSRNMRGIHMRVLRSGIVGVGDEVQIIRRG